MCIRDSHTDQTMTEVLELALRELLTPTFWFTRIAGNWPTTSRDEMAEAPVGRNKPWGLPVFCLGEFVRVTTHPSRFQTSLDRGAGFVRAARHHAKPTFAFVDPRSRLRPDLC